MHCFRNFYKLLCLGCLLALVLATRKYSPSSSLFVPTLYADLELPAAALATEQRLGFLFVARNGDPLEAMGRNTRAFEALVGYELYKYLMWLSKKRFVDATPMIGYLGACEHGVVGKWMSMGSC